MTPSIPSSSITKFFMSGAPTGWTKLTTNNDCAVRVTSGTVSAGGSTSFSSTFVGKTATGTRNVTLTASNNTAVNVISHSHPSASQAIYTSYTGSPASGPAPSISVLTWPGVDGQSVTGSTGGSAGHGHSMTTPAPMNGPVTGATINFAVNYIDVIIAQRD
jgi:hypothetical protein